VGKDRRSEERKKESLAEKDQEPVKRIANILLLFVAYKAIVSNVWAKDIRDIAFALKSQHSELSGVPVSLVVAISKVESDHRPDVTGGSGEYGLMQIMPTTYRWIFNKYGYSPPSNPYDPSTNILGGMLYLKELYRLFGNWLTVIHAYNVGPGAYQNGIRNWDYWGKVVKYWVVA